MVTVIGAAAALGDAELGPGAATAALAVAAGA